MKNYFQEIKNKIKRNISFEELEIVDNSHKHKTHKFFVPEKYHLFLKIRSNYLSSLPRIDAQKKIFKVLKEDMKNKIHALEIKIEK